MSISVVMASGLMPLPSRDRVDVAPACRRALARRRRVAARPHRIGPLLRNLATARRYAALDEHGEGYCVDIVVEGSTTDGLTRVDYEGQPIDGVLDEVGLTVDAVRCRSLPSGVLVSDVATVRAALVALFDRTAE